MDFHGRRHRSVRAMMVALTLFIGLASSCFSIDEPASREDLAPKIGEWGVLSDGANPSMWTEAEENEFSEFIAQLGRARADRVCINLASCLR